MSKELQKTLRVLATGLVAMSPVLLVAWSWFSGFTLGKYLVWSFTLYGAFTVGHLLIQYWLALRSRYDPLRTDAQYRPTVTVLVPVYNEPPHLLRQCLASLTAQTYPIQVFVANDGDDDETRHVFDEFARRGWRYTQDGHQGKRAAMKRGFDEIETELVIPIDSDTILAPDAVEQLIQPLADSTVGCATGNITVLNSHYNWLTWLTDLRYWLAFNFERAAQGYLGVMSCVSGPLGVYRMSIIRRIKDEWATQTFMGNVCTYGDDRHLTNLVLSLGFRAVYVMQARAKTQAPEKFWNWLLQQLRWSRSFYREYLLNWKWFHKHNAWLAFDMTYQAVFPFMLTVNIIVLLLTTAIYEPVYLLYWLVVVLVFGFIRAIYAVIFTKRIEFFGFTFYSLLYVVCLLPLKWIAVATLDDTGWGTR